MSRGDGSKAGRRGGMGVGCWCCLFAVGREDATVGTGEGKVQRESGGCKSLSAGRNLQVLSQFQRREMSTVRVA